MPSASASVPSVKPKQARAKAANPYRNVDSAHLTPPHGPSWSLFNTVVTIGIGIIITLIGVVYWNMKDEIKGIREDNKDMRTIETQFGRDLTNLRISVTQIGTKLDSLLQKTPAPSRP